MARDADSLEAALRELMRAVSGDTFREEAKAFEAALRASKGLTPDQRQDLRQRCQELWDKHKAFVAEQSETARRRYLEELSSLDFSYDGPPLGQTFSNWERVGEKIRACRARVKAIRASAKDDRELQPPDRKTVYKTMDSVWFKIGQSEDLAFDFHRREADRLYAEAERAADDMKPGAATAVFKASRAEVKLLWLRRSDRDIFRSLFDNLWLKLESKWEDSKRRREDWRGRQKLGLEGLRERYNKTADALRRVRENNEANREKLEEAYSESFRDRVNEWIRDGEEKEKDIERFLAELEEKIRDAEQRLRED